jgi:hypothetical protein
MYGVVQDTKTQTHLYVRKHLYRSLDVATNTGSWHISIATSCCVGSPTELLNHLKPAGYMHQQV